MKTLSVAITEKYWTQRGGLLHPHTACLGMALCVVAEPENRGAWDEAVVRLATIVTRLWPERRADATSPMECIVRFNDHLDTTYADIEKAAREYDLEVDRDA